jgi:circadian clock protein KaiB
LKTVSDARKGKEAAEWDLRLYVAGPTLKSVAALRRLQEFCDNNLAGRYSIEIIDLMKNPQLAEGDQIVALPTLVRRLPSPLRKLIGDMSNIERVLVGLDLRPRDENLFDRVKGNENV